MNNESVWQVALGELELSLSKANFTTWFKNTFIAEINDDTVVVGVPNAFTKAWLENKYHDAICAAIKTASENALKSVTYTIVSESAAQKARSAPRDAATEQGVKMVNSARQDTATSADADSPLNPHYTFDTFIAGKTNELAKAAALAITDNLGATYNPLFIYSGVGLGKTHLMQAIGNKILDGNRRANIRYTTCEAFTNEFIDAVRGGRSREFKDIYRTVDVLMIDDIQFLVGKESTQEEFFHTFNHLHQSRKQIVITSDRPPKALPTIEQRLISRFEWGMIVDMSTPDLETRIAILRDKCRLKGVDLSEDIIRYIATIIQNNIRELEGALNRLQAYHELSGTPSTLDAAKNILSSVSSAPKRGAITPKKLLDTVADYFDISIDDLKGTSRKRGLVVPRQITMYLMREEIRSSFPSIGQELGGRDHTTAMHAHNKITEEVRSNERVEHDINLIRQRLYNAV